MPDSHYFPRGISIRGGAFGIRSVGSIATSSGITAVGDIDISAGGVDLAVSVTTSGTNLVSYGAHYFSGTTATYLLADPEVGRAVFFYGGAATGTTHTVVINNTASFFFSSSGSAAGRQFAANGGFSAEIFGTSSGQYVVRGIRGNVVFSSST